MHLTRVHGTLTRAQDKTFGLKNKKGKKQQEFVKQVQNQVRAPKSNEERKVCRSSAIGGACLCVK